MALQRFLVFVVLSCTGLLVWAETPVSERFKLEQSAFGGAAGQADASTLGAGVTHGQSVVGVASSASFVVQSGFWGHAGSGHVPVFLRADKRVAPVAAVELSWTGLEPQFDVYRSTNCSDVAADYFDSTVENRYSDPLAPGLHCYLVTPADRDLPSPNAPPRNGPEEERK